MKAYKLISLISLLITAGFSSVWFNSADANGTITDQVNHLSDHLDQFNEEVLWLIKSYDGVVAEYEVNGKVETDQLLEFWEKVDFHAAIETQYVPIYASIWQGIYGIKTTIDEGADKSKVRMEQEKLNQAFWQALGAVKMAAQYQQRGLAPKVMTSEVEPKTHDEILQDIMNRLDRVIAKYAEQLNKVAVTLVHDTYLQRFEGIEGDLIALDAQLVEDLEKDFNVTLPKAMDGKTSVDQVRVIVADMKTKLSRAQQLLADKNANKKSVF